MCGTKFLTSLIIPSSWFKSIEGLCNIEVFTDESEEANTKPDNHSADEDELAKGVFGDILEGVDR